MADPCGSSDSENMLSFLQILLHNSSSSAATTDCAASAAASGLLCGGGPPASVVKHSSSVNPSTRVKCMVSRCDVNEIQFFCSILKESEASEIPDNPYPTPPRSSKRSTAVEVHNLSEKSRRSQINEKLKAFQGLIPNSSKIDKASMLDEAIEYLKQLQLQVQDDTFSRLLLDISCPRNNSSRGVSSSLYKQIGRRCALNCSWIYEYERLMFRGLRNCELTTSSAEAY